MSVIRNLFVYGSLRRGVENEHARLLMSSAVYVGAARVNGRLYRIAEYPGLVIDGDPNLFVRGDLFELNDPAAILPILDEFEGAEYRRVAITATLLERDDRKDAWVYEKDAWVYEYALDTTGKPLISSGDFLAR